MDSCCPRRIKYTDKIPEEHSDNVTLGICRNKRQCQDPRGARSDSCKKPEQKLPVLIDVQKEEYFQERTEFRPKGILRAVGVNETTQTECHAMTPEIRYSIVKKQETRDKIKKEKSRKPRLVFRSQLYECGDSYIPKGLKFNVEPRGKEPDSPHGYENDILRGERPAPVYPPPAPAPPPPDHLDN